MPDYLGLKLEFVMKHKTKITLVFLQIVAVFFLATSFAQAQDGNAEAGKGLYAVCSGCHGADGMGMEATNSPRLQGQLESYLIRQLQYFKSGIRGSHKDDTYGATMKGMAATLPHDQAIRDVVAYISTL